MKDQVHKYCHYIHSAYKHGEEQNDKLILDGSYSKPREFDCT